MPSRTVGSTRLNRISRQVSKRASRAMHLRMDELFDLLEEDVDQVEVSVTLAEMLALRATPKTIVAAPGSDKVLEFVGAILIYEAGAAAFTLSGDDDLRLLYTGAGGAAVSGVLDTAGFIDQATDQIRSVIPVSAAMVANSPIVLHNIGSAEWTVGTGAEFRVICTYRTHVLNL